jgi:hypothetical protein
MSTNAALFLFLAAGAVAMFAFVSIATWVGTQSIERKARDRFALLKTLAETPGENAAQVLQMLRDQEERQAAFKAAQERRGFLIGGLACIASGAGLAVMLTALGGKSGAWTVGLIPLLIGLALVPFGLSRGLGGGPGGK